MVHISEMLMKLGKMIIKTMTRYLLAVLTVLILFCFGCNSSLDGKNDIGEHVAAGMYFYKLIAGDFSQTKKMILLK